MPYSTIENKSEPTESQGLIHQEIDQNEKKQLKLKFNTPPQTEQNKLQGKRRQPFTRSKDKLPKKTRKTNSIDKIKTQD